MKPDQDPAARLAGAGSLRMVFVMLGATLATTFFGELAIMLAMPYLMPGDTSEIGRSLLDALLLSVLLTAATLPLMLHYRRRVLRVEQRALRVQHTLDRHAIVSIADVTGRITFANDRFCEISGYSRQELLGQNHRILKSGVHPPEVYADMWGTIARGATWHGEVCNRDKSGSFYWVNATLSPFMNERGKPEEYVAIRTDITAQKMLELASRKQELRVRTILDNLGEGVYTLDAKGRLVYMNAEAERLLGWRFEDLAGKPLHDIIHHHRRDGQALAAAECPIYLAMRDSRVYRSSDELFFRKDGSPLPVKVTGAPLSLEDDRLGSVAVFSDMREEQLLTRHLLEAKNAAEDAARVKADFLSTMSHEIRTPLNGVIGMTDLLLDTPLDGEQTEFARAIKISADALMAIINDILDFSKIEAGRMVLEHTGFSLRQTLEGCLDVLAARAKEKRLTLASFIAADVPDHLIGDPTRIRQILLNFLSNALKFAERGEVVASAAREATVPGDATRVMVRLAVRDCGIGLSDEAKAGLFQPFSQADSSTTRKYGGTGLGLSICKRLAEAMGGSIGVDSISGAGSTFWVLVPLEVAEEKRADRLLEATLCGKRVLFAGDGDASRALWSSYLEAWQVRPEGVATVAELRRRLRELKHSGDAPDALLLLEPLADSTLIDAVIDVQTDERRPTVCCQARSDRAAKAALVARGVVVMQQPMKQSALSRALLEALGTAQAAPARRQSDDADRVPVAASSTPTHRLLLAEDNPVNQRVAAHMLGKLGYSVDVVDNGALAVSAAISGEYSLVLMDCQMPEMDGFAATAAIRRTEAESRHLPIIAMTANAMQGDREQCLAAGMDDYVAKPIDVSQLAAVLAAWLPSDAAEPVVAEGPSPPTFAGAEPIDMNRLIDLFGDDDAVIEELLGVFRKSLAPMRERLRREVRQRGGNLKMVTHELRGSAANVGAVSMAELAGRLERLAAETDWDVIEPLAAQIDREFVRLDDFILGYAAKRKV